VPVNKEVQSIKSITLNVKKTKPTRKTPNNSPNKYDIGYIMESENDNRIYKVTETKNGNRRWMLNTK